MVNKIAFSLIVIFCQKSNLRWYRTIR